MRNLSLLFLLPALLLAGCDETVPAVKDPRRIVVNGQPMTPSAFLERYCRGDQVQNPSCEAVSRAYVQDAVHGPMPKGW